MNISANDLQSFRPYYPGELVKEELECRGIKQKEFAKKFELSYSALNEVLNGKRPITTEFALVLKAAFRHQCRLTGTDANRLQHPSSAKEPLSA